MLQPEINILLEETIMVHKPYPGMCFKQIPHNPFTHNPILCGQMRTVWQLYDLLRHVIPEQIFIFLPLACLEQINRPVGCILNKIVQASKPKAVGPPGNDNNIAVDFGRLGQAFFLSVQHSVFIKMIQQRRKVLAEQSPQNSAKIELMTFIRSIRMPIMGRRHLTRTC